MNKDEFRVALLANPYMRFRHEVNITNSREFIKNNKLSLLLMKKGINDPEFASDAYFNVKLISELHHLVNLFKHNNIDYVLIKWLTLPRPQNDLDIMSPDYSKICNILDDDGYILDSTTPYRITYLKDDIEVDIHTDAAWSGVKYLDMTPILNYKNYTNFQYNNKDFIVYTPSIVYQLLITAAHSMRENRITLYDVLSVYPMLSEYAMNHASYIAKQFGWHSQFNRFIDKVIDIYNLIYIKHEYKHLTLPYRFPIYTSARLKFYKSLHDLINGRPTLTPYLTDIKEVIRCRLMS